MDHGLSSALTEKPDETSVNVRLVTGERGRRLKGEKKNTKNGCSVIQACQLAELRRAMN